MSVTYATGFTAAGLAAGLKANGGKDVAVVCNTGPEFAAGAVFTPNRFCAAPVQWSRAAMARNAQLGTAARAVVLNSAGANACTGAAGFADTEATAQVVAEALHLPLEQVLVCSTGLIGERLKLDLLLPGAKQACAELSATAGQDAAEAIMTTDTHPKLAVAQGPGYRVGGMAKGAGMLAPWLATMLVVITTDARLTSEQAQAALSEACRTTFNRIDSDGCQSTNDTVILLASGASGVAPQMPEFTQTLRSVAADLARQLIGDAEGASHDIRIDVVNAADEDGAVAVARSIARYNLLKAAIFGNDPNWGRVLAAFGALPAETVPYDPAKVDVAINGVTVCRGGGVGEDRTRVDLSAREVSIQVDLNAGDQRATLWTNDLTHDYVHENSAYSS
ncbi:MAG: bifunctional glutamate N-acetyltransferase/amino-acid acetyltransferase ArgJ [Propionibacteriaceae bacterium]|jgi:glutamate N-acetyltransferase/amino-acid N-acetyltransferase|nr:bifunctional glutamate N-acetyltransferase/amino-acid acetyltransferase ArgJ [Propionibacteriaceae bacterium]